MRIVYNNSGFKYGNLGKHSSGRVPVNKMINCEKTEKTSAVGGYKAELCHDAFIIDS